ncbi:MAG: recombinase family protein [Clostridia bacterium]|nr:recombinase family protein [Clostridia bacterium]
MQRHESITAQLRAIDDYAKSHGHEIAAIYTDEALSGRSMKRPQFLAMMAAARRREFEGVIVYYLARLSRSLEDHVLIERDFARMGISLISVKEPDADTPNGRMVRGIMQVLSQHESEQLGERVLYGMRESAHKGIHMGPAPIGYIKDADKRLQADPRTAPHVVRVFEMFWAGHSYYECSEYLAAHGILSARTGKPYDPSSMSYLLRNRIYIGEYAYDDIIIPGGVPAIVPDGLFDSVNERLANFRAVQRSYKASRRFPLTGHLFCACCGNKITGTVCTANRAQNRYAYYLCATCNSKKQRRETSQRSYATRAEALEARVVEALRDQVFSPASLQRIATEIHRQLVEENRSSSFPELSARMRELDREIKNCTDAILAVGVSPALAATLKTKEAERASILSRLRAQRSPNDLPTQSFIEASLRKQYKHFTLDDDHLCEALTAVGFHGIYACPEPRSGFTLEATCALHLCGDESGSPISSKNSTPPWDLVTAPGLGWGTPCTPRGPAP